MIKCIGCNQENSPGSVFCEFCGQKLVLAGRREGPRIRIRHLSGARADQEDLFGLHQHDLLILGREPTAHINFDSERDVVVSRQHAAIAIDPRRDDTFQVIDLASSNGVFINNKKITGKGKLKHGDVIRVGVEGPEIQFLRDPAPDQDLLETRIIMPRERGSSGNDRAPDTPIGWLDRVKAYAAAAIAAIANVFR